MKNKILNISVLFLFLPAMAAADVSGNTAYSRVIRYVDMVDKPVKLSGFVKAGSFYGGRYSQKGTDNTGRVWYFRGGTYKAYHKSGALKEERYYSRKLFLMIYERYVPNGVWKYYDASGKKYMEEIYIDGRKMMVINYDNDGNILSKTNSR